MKILMIDCKALTLTSVAAAALMLSACASVERIAVTPSGRPEVIFVDASAAEIVARISDACLDKGLMVSDASDNAVTCGGALSGTGGALYTALMTPRYSTPPMAQVQFTVIALEARVRVAAQGWIESQTAFGRVDRRELNNNFDFNTIQQFLYDLGGQPVDMAGPDG